MARAMSGIDAFANYGQLNPIVPFSNSLSESRSGERYTPQQQRLLDDLLPWLSSRFQQSAGGGAPSASFGTLAREVGGTSQIDTRRQTGPDLRQVGQGDFGLPYRFDPLTALPVPTDYGRAQPTQDITQDLIWTDQLKKEAINSLAALPHQQIENYRTQEANRAAAGGNSINSRGPLAGLMDRAAVVLGSTTDSIRRFMEGAAQTNAEHRLKTEQAAVERAMGLSRDDLARRELGGQERMRMAELAAQQQSQRDRTASAYGLQRSQLINDDKFRGTQLANQNTLDRWRLAEENNTARQLAADQSDISRRNIALGYHQANQSRAQNEMGALASLLAQTTRPQSFSESSSRQNSGSKRLGLQLGGQYSGGGGGGNFGYGMTRGLLG